MNKLIFQKESGIKAVAWLSQLIPSLKDKEYVIEIKEHKKRRSLDANAYCWVLIDKLAEHMQSDKEVIYKNAIRDIGGVSDIICVPNKSVDKIRIAWSKHGLGWQTEELPSKIDGCTNVVLYYGSSTYDSKQMSKLIDSLVQDCKAVGIETIPPKELEAMIKAYGIS